MTEQPESNRLSCIVTVFLSQKEMKNILTVVLNVRGDCIVAEFLGIVPERRTD